MCTYVCGLEETISSASFMYSDYKCNMKCNALNWKFSVPYLDMVSWDLRGTDTDWQQT